MPQQTGVVFVSLSPRPTAPGALAGAALETLPDDVPSALALAIRLGPVGDTGLRDLWEMLATVASNDLGAVRVIEPHLDAIGILAQAGIVGVDGTWGVFASEGGDVPLTAVQADGGWIVSGTKQWCSLAGVLDAALVTATQADGSRRLMSVRLAHPGVSVVQGAWVARGLTEIASGPVHFDGVPATPVGQPGWYLQRPGFAWGGIGVAACWFGGAVGIARTVLGAARSKDDPFVFAHLGAVDELLQSCRRALFEAAELAADPTADARLGSAPGAADRRTDARLTAKRVRATVARAAEEIIGRAGHALGPAPLALDAAHAKRVADLQLYVRQHHAERDQASLGEALVRGAREALGGGSSEDSGSFPW